MAIKVVKGLQMRNSINKSNQPLNIITSNEKVKINHKLKKRGEILKLITIEITKNKKKKKEIQQHKNNIEKLTEWEKTEEQGKNEEFDIYEKSNEKKILEMYHDYIIVS